jgi:hypothetical protein
VIAVPQGLAPARRRAPWGVVVTCCALAVAAFPAAASANTVNCGGTAKPGKGEPNELVYALHCTEEVKSFSIVASGLLDSFGAETTLTPAAGGPLGKLFACEGEIPSYGFGCSGGDLPPRATVGGTLVTDKPRCADRHNPLRLWMVAVDANGASSGAFPIRSPKCAKPKKTAKHTRRARSQHDAH